MSAVGPINFDIILWAQNPAFMYPSVSLSHFPDPREGGKPRVQNGASGSYIDAIFKLVVQKELET